MMSEPDPPELTCSRCSKPILPGASASREGDSIVHLRCFVQQTTLRAMELQDKAAANVVRAKHVVAEARGLRAPQLAASHAHFVMFAQIAGIDHAHRVLTFGQVRIRLAEGI